MESAKDGVYVADVVFIGKPEGRMELGSSATSICFADLGKSRTSISDIRGGSCPVSALPSGVGAMGGMACEA